MNDIAFPALSGLSQLASHYDALVCDIWGVVHNGVQAHPRAVKALQAYRANGGSVVLVTNASRTEAPIRAMLDALNIPGDVCDAVVTSGDVTRHLVSTYVGKKVHIVGPETDRPMFNGIDVSEAAAEDAAAVVVTGLDHPSETPDDYRERLETWRRLGLPMICSNPDKIVEVGDKMVYCAGALADIYAEMGGEVGLAGKPYPPIYEEALRRLTDAIGRTPPRDRLLAVGDSVRTDATGAAGQGIDFLFITGSIHAEEIGSDGHEDAEAIAELVAPSGARLAGFLQKLVW